MIWIQSLLMNMVRNRNLRSQGQLSSTRATEKIARIAHKEVWVLAVTNNEMEVCPGRAPQLTNQVQFELAMSNKQRLIWAKCHHLGLVHLLVTCCHQLELLGPRNICHIHRWCLGQACHRNTWWWVHLWCTLNHTVWCHHLALACHQCHNQASHQPCLLIL